LCRPALSPGKFLFNAPTGAMRSSSSVDTDPDGSRPSQRVYKIMNRNSRLVLDIENINTSIVINNTDRGTTTDANNGNSFPSDPTCQHSGGRTPGGQTRTKRRSLRRWQPPETWSLLSGTLPWNPTPQGWANRARRSPPPARMVSACLTLPWTSISVVSAVGIIGTIRPHGPGVDVGCPCAWIRGVIGMLPPWGV
jgi:hypothetical protein